MPINPETYDILVGNIAYNDEVHVYWDLMTDERYTSVTTLIGRYKKPFDGDFWSDYKAIEELLEEFFKQYRGGFASFELMIKDFKSKLKPGSKDHLRFIAIKTALLQQWDFTRDQSCVRGTAFHKAKEDFWKSKDYHFTQGGFYDTAKTNLIIDPADGIYSELLLYNHEYKLAGQADLVLKKGGKIIIRDYKTNKELKLKSYYNRKTDKYDMMLGPLSNVQDCNYQHYVVQLSTYAWMIQQLGDYEIEGLYLDHFDHKGNYTEYKVPYKKDTVIRMLNDFKAQ